MRGCQTPDSRHSGSLHHRLHHQIASADGVKTSPTTLAHALISRIAQIVFPSQFCHTDNSVSLSPREAASYLGLQFDSKFKTKK